MPHASAHSAPPWRCPEQPLERPRAELDPRQARHDELAARMRTLENRSLVRAAVWLGGGENPAEGRSTS